MSGMQDLFTALNMLKQNVNEFATGQAIMSANEQVNQLKAAQMNEQERRAGLQAISNDLVMRMGAMGASPTQVAQTAQAIAPQYSSPAEAAMQGAMVGDKSLMAAAREADMAAQAGNIEQLKQQQAFQARENALTRNHQLELAGLRTSGKAGGKAITDSQVNAFSNALAQEKGFQTLLDEVNNNTGLVGPVDGFFAGARSKLDKDYASFRTKTKMLFNAYRTAVTGAGASEGEIKMLEEAFPTGDETEDAYRAKVKAVVEMGRNILSSKLDVLEGSGYNVGNLKNVVQNAPSPFRAPATPGKGGSGVTAPSSGGSNKHLQLY